MRVVIQRVKEASVTIAGLQKASIGPGLLIFAGFEATDGVEDIDWCVRKVSQLRVFDDEQGVMNLPVTEVNGGLLVVSQFTLHASTKKGNRPSYIKAANPQIAIPLYEQFCTRLAEVSGIAVETGTFGADMAVALVNDGPVTLCIDTKNKE